MKKISVFTFLLLWSGILLAQTNVQDSMALVDLYHATNGENWNDNTNWLQTNVNRWSNIEVHNGRVTHIYFRNNNMQGTIPVSIGDMTKLVQINFEMNNISGSLPPEIGNLTELRYLYIWHTNISGTIPKEIGKLTNLIHLHLDKNNLTGTVPVEIGNLIKLEELYLDHNAELTGDFPDEICNLTNLKILCLDFDNLTGSLPEEIGNLTNLTELGLYDNNLTGQIPASLSNLTKVENLMLGSNSFHGEIPEEIGNLTSCQILVLNNNALTGDVPQSFANLINLKALFLNDNQLTGIPDLSHIEFPFTKHEYGFYQTLSIRNNNLEFDDLEKNIAVLPHDTLYAPQAKIEPLHSSIKRNVGDNLNLTITVGGENNLYQWFNSVNEPLNTPGPSPDFSIENISESNGGKYICRITNTQVPDLTLETLPIELIVTNECELDDTKPVISCATDRTVASDETTHTYTVNGTELDPIEASDNCGIAGIVNDFNNLSTLGGAELPEGMNTIIWTITDNSGNTQTCSQHITVDQYVGIEALQQKGISVYPNPTSGILKFEYNNGYILNVKIYDLRGILIHQKKQPQNNIMNISSIENGTYLIRIKTDKETIITKILKE